MVATSKAPTSSECPVEEKISERTSLEWFEEGGYGDRVRVRRWGQCPKGRGRSEGHKKGERRKWRRKEGKEQTWVDAPSGSG